MCLREVLKHTSGFIVSGIRQQPDIPESILEPLDLFLGDVNVLIS